MSGKPFHSATTNKSGHSAITASVSDAGLASGVSSTCANRRKPLGRSTTKAVALTSLIRLPALPLVCMKALGETGKRGGWFAARGRLRPPIRRRLTGPLPTLNSRRFEQSVLANGGQCAIAPRSGTTALTAFERLQVAGHYGYFDHASGDGRRHLY